MSALSILRVVSRPTRFGFFASCCPRICAAARVSSRRSFVPLAFPAIPASCLTVLTRSTRRLGFGDAGRLVHLALALSLLLFFFDADVRKFGDFDFRESASEAEDA